MVNSLRFRLLLFMTLVLIVTGVLAALFASRAIMEHFTRYVVYQDNASAERRRRLEAVLPPVLEAYYAQNVTWEDIDKLLATFGERTEERIILSNPDGSIIMDSAYLLAGQPSSDEVEGLKIPIRLGEQVVAEMKIVPIVGEDAESEESAFITSVNNSLVWAVLWAGAISILLALLFSRSILQPIENLTRAVRKIGSGDLQQKVSVSSQNEIGELANAFNIMTDSLAQVERLRRNMVTDIAHELRTPLSNIQGYLEAIQDGVVEPKPETISSLLEEANLLNHLVEDLQELAQAEAGQLKLIYQPIRLDKIIEQATRMASYSDNHKNIRLKIDIPPQIPLVHVDSDRIGQVLRNLLNNAFLHTPPGGEIQIKARELESRVQVSIHNSGPGIPTEHLPYLFERFYRVDSSRTRMTGGSGLGLAIVKQFVVAHGGKVWAESTLGKEAIFHFTLPTSHPASIT